MLNNAGAADRRLNNTTRMETNSQSQLPPDAPNQTYVSISALDAGHLTLPEKLFVTNADPEKHATVPSLSFLIQHPSPSENGRPNTHMIFDLGLKRDLSKYTSAMQSHIANRQPTITDPDAAASLRAGGLDPEKDVDIVMLSHVHWDHVGTPSDFASAKFVMGSGTLDVLDNGAGPHYPAEVFNKDLLPRDRTFELPPSDNAATPKAKPAEKQTDHTWKSLAGFPNTIDFFNDGSVYIIDAPGHISGHVNLLARIGPAKWIYLGGDCCHDVRILEGVKDIAMYDDGHGGLRSVHMDTGKAKSTLANLREFLDRCKEVEVVVAHDKTWRERNRERFWPGKL